MKIKSFKTYTEKKSNFINAHGSHAQAKKKSNFVNAHGSHAKIPKKKFFFNEAKIPHIEDYESHIEKLHRKEFGHTLPADIMQTLHDNHPLTENEDTRNALDHYSQSSSALNYALVKAHNEGKEAPESIEIGRAHV